MSFQERAQAARQPAYVTVDTVLAALTDTERDALTSMLTNRAIGASGLRVDINEELEEQSIPFKVSEKAILTWRRANDVR